MKRRFPCGRRGFILAPVLVSAALLITISTGLAWTARGTVAGAESLRFIAETESVAETVSYLLSTMIASDINRYDSFSEQIEMRIGKFDVTALIEPLEGKIPLSGLFLPDGVTVRSEYLYPWQRIWEELGLEDIEPVATDFMDSDVRQRPGGIESDIWINRPPKHISEFRILKMGGMNNLLSDSAIYGNRGSEPGLDDYISVYGTEKININVAPVQVIAILDRRIGIDAARSLEYYRLKRPIENIGDLRNVTGFPASAISRIRNIIKFESDYFLIKMTVTAQKTKRSRNFIITVKKKDGAVKTVRWEE